MTCPNCGANVVNNTMARCPYCGAELGRPSGGYAPQSSAPVQQPVYQQAYQQPAQNVGQQNTGGSVRGKMIASMVLGISSVVIAWGSWLSLLALAAGIVGLVLGVKAKQSAPAGMPMGMATAGIVCSIVGIALSGLVLVYILL